MQLIGTFVFHHYLQSRQQIGKVLINLGSNAAYRYLCFSHMQISGFLMIRLINFPKCLDYSGLDNKCRHSSTIST